MVIQKKNFYFNFLGFLIKKGKKNLAITLLKKSLTRSSALLKLPIYYILSQIFIKLNAYVEVRKVTIKSRSHFVPFPISFNRRSYLVAKWFLLALKANVNQTSLVSKIALEIITLLKKSSLSHAYNLKLENEKKALTNRANIHYRW